MIPFPFNENRFSFFFFFFVVVDHLLVGQLCTNPKSDRSLLSGLKVTQYSTSEIGDELLDNSCSLPIQLMTTGPLPAPSKCKSGFPRITGTCLGWWKQSFRLQLWSLVWFQVRATSCHLTSSKSAWKSTPKCTWMCRRVWWSPGVIRVAGGRPWVWQQNSAPAHKFKETQAWLQKECYDFVPFLTAPSSTDLSPLHLVIRREHHQHDLHNTKASLIAAIRRVFVELPPALVEKACSQFRIRIEAVIEAEGGYIELMSALLHNQLTWIYFFNKSFKIKLSCYFLLDDNFIVPPCSYFY